MKLTRKQKHYIQEIIVFGSLVLAVIMADAVHKVIKGRMVNWIDIIVNIPSLIVIIFIAIGIYGSMYSKNIKYKESADGDSPMAPLQKRIANAVSHGFAWRLMFGG